MYKVLIVDDEYLEREALKIILGRIEGVEVVGEAANGKEAVIKAESLRPDLIFLDIRMPVFDGIEASKQIRANNVNIKVILLSAYDDFKYAQSAIRTGVSDYLLKPSSPGKIQAIVKNYMSTSNVSIVERMNSHIKNKDFESTILELETIVEHIISNSKDHENIQAELLEIGEILFDNVELLTKEQFEYFIKKIVVDKNVTLDKYQIQLCLFDMINEIFVQKCIIKNQKFAQIFSLIKKNLNDDINLQFLAEESELSVSYLSRLFKKEFGINFVKYINFLKIEKAKMYLKNTELSISDIAFEIGYGESNYFCKVFKNYEGITARQYRESS